MMTMSTMRELLVQSLRAHYGAEQQLLVSLPRMLHAASPTLSSTIREHLGHTLSQVLRLEECLALLEEDAKATACTELEGLLVEAAERAEEEGNPVDRDAGLIRAAQRVARDEVAAYGASIKLAEAIGEEAIVTLLLLTVEEERATYARLAAIATSEVYVGVCHTAPHDG